MKGRKLTDTEKEQIRMFSVARMQQKQIACDLSTSVHLVRKTQKEFHLLPHSTEPLSKEIQEKILKLFGDNHGSPYIARNLGVAQHRVERVRREHHVTHPFGFGHRYSLGPGAKRAIRRALRESERQIAKTFGVSREWLSRFRHSMWKPKKKALPHGVTGRGCIIQKTTCGRGLARTVAS